MPTVQTGLETFLASPPQWVAGKRFGLLCNASSVDHTFTHARTLIANQFPDQLKALLSPQHGFFAEKQDNMIESDHIMDSMLNIPVYSLYGQTRMPTKDMFDGIDILLIDLQDVGTRVYTFVHTVSYCLEAAKAYNKRVLILDRPNPIGGHKIEGNCLSLDCRSFVGRYPIPMRHGMTIGELSMLLNQAFDIHCDLNVIPMTGWHRNMDFQDTGLFWMLPSPNLPTPTSALVYPGQVIWEGTNVSEGRGTTQPFEIFGAPFINTDKVLDALGGDTLPGAVLRPVCFEPTSNKWQEHLCRGFQIHVTDPEIFTPYKNSLKLLRIIYQLYKGKFQWKQPPYEYEYKRLPIDLIIGDADIRRRIEQFDEVGTIEASWQKALSDFDTLRRKYYLYE